MTEEQDGRVSGGGEHVNTAEGAEMVRGRAFPLGPRYTDFKFLGEGAYGLVASALDAATGGQVAVKRLSLADNLSMAQRALREVKILSRLSHPCVVPVLNVITAADARDVTEVYLVLRLMETDLHKVIKALRAQGRRIPAEHTCFWTYQLLRGLKYMHSAAVLHRDLKPQNILLNSNSTCDLVVCDFGLSRVLDPAHPPRLSEFVVTRWYRAPEVTLTLNQYSSKMDLWSVGCILAEMLGGRPLFPGTNAIDQMQRILTVIGSPAEEDLAWIASESTREYMRSQPQRPPTDLAAIFPDADPLALGLLAALLHFNPDRRPSAAEALAHPYFVQRQYHNPEDEPEAERPLSADDMGVEMLTMERVKEAFVAEASRFQAIQTAAAAQEAATAAAQAEPIDVPLTGRHTETAADDDDNAVVKMGTTPDY